MLCVEYAWYWTGIGYLLLVFSPFAAQTQKNWGAWARENSETPVARANQCPRRQPESSSRFTEVPLGWTKSDRYGVICQVEQCGYWRDSRFMRASCQIFDIDWMRPFFGGSSWGEQPLWVYQSDNQRGRFPVDCTCGNMWPRTVQRCRGRRGLWPVRASERAVAKLQNIGQGSYQTSVVIGGEVYLHASSMASRL